MIVNEGTRLGEGQWLRLKAWLNTYKGQLALFVFGLCFMHVLFKFVPFLKDNEDLIGVITCNIVTVSLISICPWWHLRYMRRKPHEVAKARWRFIFGFPVLLIIFGVLLGFGFFWNGGDVVEGRYWGCMLHSILLAMGAVVWTPIIHKTVNELLDKIEKEPSQEKVTV